MRFRSRELWDDDDTGARWLVIAIVLSFLLHGYVAWKAPRFGGLPDPATGKDTPIEVGRYVEQKPFASTSRSEEDVPDAKARFGGEFKNRVREETRAERSGRFNEGGGGQKRAERLDPLAPNPGQLGMRDLLPGAGGGPGSGVSSNPYELPRDVRVGRQTLLNTDPIRFASFLRRLSEEIYDPWVRLVRGAFDDIRRSGGKLGNRPYVTQLGVWMNSKGEVTAIEVLQSSGVALFDEAAKQAFWETEPYHNPPPQLFEKEDPTRFAFGFTIETSTGLFNVAPFRM